MTADVKTTRAEDENIVRGESDDFLITSPDCVNIVRVFKKCGFNGQERRIVLYASVERDMSNNPHRLYPENTLNLTGKDIFIHRNDKSIAYSFEDDKGIDTRLSEYDRSKRSNLDREGIRNVIVSEDEFAMTYTAWHIDVNVYVLPLSRTPHKNVVDIRENNLCLVNSVRHTQNDSLGEVNLTDMEIALMLKKRILSEM